MKKTLSPKLALLAAAAAALGLGATEPQKPPPPPIAEGLEEARSDPPAHAEWEHAPEVSLARAPAGCVAARLREWTTIHCNVCGDMGASLVAGPREGVSFAHEPFGCAVEITFPVRRGDRRVLEMMKGVSSPFSFSAYSFESDAAFVISEAWLPADPEPLIVID
jgi:hypothetical protein